MAPLSDGYTLASRGRKRKSENYGDLAHCTRSRFTSGGTFKSVPLFAGQITEATFRDARCLPNCYLRNRRFLRYTASRVKRFSGILTRGRRREEPGERVQRGPFNQYHVSRMQRVRLIMLFSRAARFPSRPWPNREQDQIRRPYRVATTTTRDVPAREPIRHLCVLITRPRSNQSFVVHRPSAPANFYPSPLLRLLRDRSLPLRILPRNIRKHDANLVIERDASPIY